MLGEDGLKVLHGVLDLLYNGELDPDRILALRQHVNRGALGSAARSLLFQRQLMVLMVLI